MTTKNLVPRTSGEGQIGTSSKKWSQANFVSGSFDELNIGASSLDEKIDDRVNDLLTAGSNVTLTYDDNANTLTIAATGGGASALNDLSDVSTSSIAPAQFLVTNNTNTFVNRTITGDINISNVGASTIQSSVITGRTEETSANDADFILIYDSSATALRKMTRANFTAGLSGGGGASALNDLSDVTISTPSSGQILVYDGADSFDNVSISGDATLNSSGVLTISASSVENSMLAGSIANDKLSNSSITVGTTAISLGGTSTTLNLNIL